MLNRSSRWLLLIIVIIAVPFWWLMIARDRGTLPAKPIPIAELRTLAAALHGARPTGVTYTVLATRTTSGDFYAAGMGLARRRLALVAYILPISGKGPILIDPGPSPRADREKFGNFNAARQNWLNLQARTASHIFHMQGHQDELPRPDRPHGQVKAGVDHPPRPVLPAMAHAIAPGVVVIPADGVAPGVRLIFVRLADDREFLFVGDIAALKENWLRLRARSHLADIWGPPQNRAETYAWLRTIRQWHSEAPNMKIMPGNDAQWLVAQRGAGAATEQDPARAVPALTPGTQPGVGKLPQHGDRRWPSPKA